jgi:uncharacterized RDD family membrane protein YckC
MSMKCQKCGADNVDNALFCQQCGAPMGFRAPSTQQPMVETQGNKPPASLSPSPSPSPYAAPRATNTASEIPTADVFAGFWRRLAAAIIDGIVTNIVFYALSFAVIGTATIAGSSEVVGVAGIGLYLFSIIGNWLYFALMESSSAQATLGKVALGIIVTDEAGERIGFGKATGRYFGKIISSLILAIGFLMAAWTRKRQGLHDIMAGCLVVRKSADTAVIASGVIAPPVSGAAIAGIIAAACFVIALPVIGILAAIAIPQYQEYLNRAKLTQVYQLMKPAQAAVSKYYAKNEAAPATLEIAGFITPASPDIGEVTIDAEGVISINLATPSLDGKSLLFIPEANDKNELTWTCRSEDIKQKLLPAVCKG